MTAILSGKLPVDPGMLASAASQSTAMRGEFHTCLRTGLSGDSYPQPFPEPAGALYKFTWRTLLRPEEEVSHHLSGDLG